MFEEAPLPPAPPDSLGDGWQLPEAPKTELLPPHTIPAEFIPIYTVILRRSDLLTVRERRTIQRPEDVAALVQEYLKESDREHLVVVLLDTKNAVIGINTASVGILDSALAHPREVFKPAILANAAAIILAHNHPSGDPTPSPEDGQLAQRILAAGRILGIDLLDHIVVGEGKRFASLRERGMM